MIVEKALYANPFLKIALIERNGKWSAEIGNRIYYWNCVSKEEVIEKARQRVMEITENETKLFFKEHFSCT